MNSEALLKRIFSLQTQKEFEEIALEVFNYQYRRNAVYKEYADLIKRNKPQSVNEIPFLPISFFKTHRVSCHPNEDLIFMSSGTTEMIRSKHYVHSLQIYEASFNLCYDAQIGNPEEQIIIALLPNYIEQGNSSLVYMVDHLVKRTKSSLSGFYLNHVSEVEQVYKSAIEQGKKVVIFGVSYALLDLAEQGIDLSFAMVIETGGMKGRRKELSKNELHTYLIKGLNLSYVASEYGMTELLSQAYSNNEGIFQCPPWMRIELRDINDPFSSARPGKTGGINVIDLANLESCSFIATQDLARLATAQKNNIHPDFELMGRFDNADIRGCNLMVE